MSTESVLELTQKLAKVRNRLDKQEKIAREIISPLKELKTELSDLLLAELQTSGLKQVKSNENITYSIGVRKALKINNPLMYQKFATKHNLISVDSRLVNEYMKIHDIVPTGTELMEKPYLSMRKPTVKKAK